MRHRICWCKRVWSCCFSIHFTLSIVIPTLHLCEHGDSIRKCWTTGFTPTLSSMYIARMLHAILKVVWELGLVWILEWHSSMCWSNIEEWKRVEAFPSEWDNTVLLLQVVFSPGSAVNPEGSSQHYKVFLKAEEAKKNKSDIWTVSAAETSKKESKALLVCFN